MSLPSSTTGTIDKDDSGGMDKHYRYSLCLLNKIGPEIAPASSQKLAGQKRKLNTSGTAVVSNNTNTLSSSSSSLLALSDGAPNKSKSARQSLSAYGLSPSTLVAQIFKENGFDMHDTTTPFGLSIPFEKPTERRIAAYQTDTVKIARSDDVEQLRLLFQSGVDLDCCNRFGESLVSMACRRGSVKLVRFLVEEANVSLLVRDDFGRTVLHDAFWTTEPRFELMEFLLSEVPDLLCVRDVRGHFPLDYIRSEHWTKWTNFLQERRHLLWPKLSISVSPEPIVNLCN